MSCAFSGQVACGRQSLEFIEMSGRDLRSELQLAGRESRQWLLAGCHSMEAGASWTLPNEEVAGKGKCALNVKDKWHQRAAFRSDGGRASLFNGWSSRHWTDRKARGFLGLFHSVAQSRTAAEQVSSSQPELSGCKAPATGSIETEPASSFGNLNQQSVSRLISESHMYRLATRVAKKRE